MKWVKSRPTCPCRCASDSPRAHIFVAFCCGATHLLVKYWDRAPVQLSVSGSSVLLQMVPLPVVYPCAVRKLKVTGRSSCGPYRMSLKARGGPFNRRAFSFFTTYSVMGLKLGSKVCQQQHY